MTADSTSVTQKACQTPVGPSWRQSSHASGMMKMTYRQREMTSEAAPLPRPSSAPEEVVDTADTTKPRQMMRRAVWPMAMVSGLEENRPMRGAETVSIFGGLINGLCISLCLIGNTSTGGTDFIAIYFSEKNGRDIWNYILCGNAVILTVAGLLFGWDRALYSIIFQFTSTQVIQMLHQRYKKHTLFIITKEPYQIYEEIFKLTNHTATRFEGTGCYTDEKTSMIYSVVSTEEAKYLVKKVHEIDPKAFVNIIKTDYINGRFYQKTDY